MAGLLDPILGDGDAPDYKAPSISQEGYHAVVDPAETQINNSDEKILKDRTQSYDANAGLLAERTGDPLKDAIRNQYSDRYKSDMDTMKTQQSVMSQMDRSRLLARSIQQTNTLVQYNAHITQMLDAARANKEAARNQVLMNVLNIGMVGAGIALGGVGGLAVGLGSKMLPKQKPDPGPATPAPPLQNNESNMQLGPTNDMNAFGSGDTNYG